MEGPGLVSTRPLSKRISNRWLTLFESKFQTLVKQAFFSWLEMNRLTLQIVREPEFGSIWIRSDDGKKKFQRGR